MTEATPRPWSASHQFLYGGEIESPLPIASGKHDWATDRGGPCFDEACANAAHIVHCVNAHDALVATLADIAKWAEKSASKQAGTVECLWDIHERALAVLAQAREPRS